MENQKATLRIRDEYTPGTVAVMACLKIRSRISKLRNAGEITTDNGTIHIRLTPRSEEADIWLGGASGWKGQSMFAPCNYEWSFPIVEEVSKIRLVGEERLDTAAYAVMQLEYARLKKLRQILGTEKGTKVNDLREINGFVAREGYFNVIIIDPRLPKHVQEVLDVWVSVMAGSAVHLLRWGH